MNINPKLLVVVILFFFCSIKPVSATAIFLQFLYTYYTTNTAVESAILMAEICNNGLDDDGDGLVDAFDEDCNCNQLASNQNLVPNGDFESRFGCCESIESQGDNCLSNWIPLNGTPDFFSSDCPSQSGTRENIEATIGALEGSILAGFLLPGSEEVSFESIGTCLNESLIAGESYTISLDIGNLIPTSYSVNEDVFFTINGIVDCTTLSTYTNHETYCNIPASFEELIAVNYFTLEDGWNQVTVTFTPTTNISAIFTSISCTQTLPIARPAYPVIDNISIIKNKVGNEVGEIALDGPYCDRLSTLSVPPILNATYRWYLDSVAISSNFEDTFIIIPETDFEGQYYVQVTEENGQCNFYGPIDFTFPSMSNTTQETRTICADESYQFGNQSITTAGEYTKTFTTSFGCDSTIELTVIVEELEEEALVVSQPAGTTYLFDEQELSVAGTYFDTINNPNGCNTFRTLRLIFTGENIENCDDGFDNDGDGLIDAFDPDCDCLIGADALISNEIIVGGNPCEGTLRFIIGEAQELPIHWFKDSIPLVRTNGGNFNFNLLNITNAAGIYHGKVTFEDGTCQLVGPLYYDGIMIPGQKNITLCAGETYQFGDTTITSAGIYLMNFPSEFSGCDSAITLNVTYLERDSTNISEMINQGESYGFSGQTLTTEGIYSTTLVKESNGCDSVVTLTLTVFTGEICGNNIDDDDDGLIDAFDEDCQCNTTDTTNFVTNGDFENYETDCCSSNNPDIANICVEGWPHHYSTVDFIHPSCIGRATPAEANYYDVPLDGAFMGVLIRYFESFIPNRPERLTSETLGQCLNETLLEGERYIISLDMGIKGNLDGTRAEVMDDLFFTVNGIADCNQLSEYITDENFCERGNPFQQLATVNLKDLGPSWNSYTFEFTPATNLEAIFVASDCDSFPAITMGHIALLDNLKIQKKPASTIPNEIMVTDNPCDENNMLVFSVEQVQGATYQWYLDSIPQPNRIQSSLTFGLNANIVGTHHVYVTFPDGSCQLIGPYNFAYQAPSSRDTITLCPGTTILVNGEIVAFEGEFTNIFPSIIDGCDSTATLVVLIDEIPHTIITDTIAEGQSYDFNETALTTTGTYRDTLPAMRGCDSIIILELTVNPPVREVCANNIDDDKDGLIDIFDPDCQCEEEVEIVPEKINLVANGNFDENQGCCTAIINTQADNCIEDWVLISTNPDYYTPDCTDNGPIEIFYDAPPDYSMVAINLFAGPIGADSEGLGSCLKEPLNVGTDYEITIDVTILSNVTATLEGDAFFTVYGIEDCAQLAEYNTNFGVCENGLTAIELLTFNARDLTPLALRTIRETISNLPTTISGILLAVNCEQQVAQDVFAYIGIASIEITPATAPTLPTNPVTTIKIDGPNCNKSTQLFVESATNTTYQWYKDSVLLEGETNALLEFATSTIDIAGTYQLNMLKNNGACQLLSTVLTEPIITANEINASICEGATYALAETTYTKSGIYTQIIPSEVSGCDSTIILNLEVLAKLIGDTIAVTQAFGTAYDFHGFTQNESGVYQVNLTSAAGCDSLIWLNLTIEGPCANLFEVVAEWSDTDCVIAENGQIILQTINGIPPFQYSIDGGTNFGGQATFNKLSAGDYEVVVRDANGCVSTNFVTISAGTSPLFLNLPADTFLFSGQSFQLNVTETNFEPMSFNWTSDAFIQCSSCSNIHIAPTESSTYTLSAIDENGCQVSDAIFIEVKPLPQLYIPTAFSPNGDGNNDVFKIEGLPENLERVAALKIFNRWGNLVYQQQKSSGQTFLEWDGSINNKAAMIDVYMYVVSWQNQRGEQEMLTGDFTLMR